jgi:predicted transcriptional regulator
MSEANCGCLPVTRGGPFGRLVGLITDRDICMAARLRRRPLRKMRVMEAMTESVWACNPEDDVSEAEAIMLEARVRRLPVVGEYGQVIGLLSLTDLVREAARQQRGKYQQITSAEVVEVMAAICTPPVAGRSGSATPPSPRAIDSEQHPRGAGESEIRDEAPTGEGARPCPKWREALRHELK